MIFVQSYKHDGSLHRTWSKGLLLDRDEHSWIVVTDHTWVVESDGRKWLTKEPAICFFYDNKWYNIISMIRRSGIYYYCNIASPSLCDAEAIKNIDYDLDVKVYPDGSYEVLDADEYTLHSAKMQYPKVIDDIVHASLKEVITKIEKGTKPFDFAYINDLLIRYLNRGDLKCE